MHDQDQLALRSVAGSARPVDATGGDADAMSVPTITLDRLPAGQCGLITAVAAEGLDLERLKAMGVCVGRRAHVVKQGEPMVVRVMGTRLGMAGEIARSIVVTPAERQPCCQQED